MCQSMMAWARRDMQPMAGQDGTGRDLAYCGYSVSSWRVWSLTTITQSRGPEAERARDEGMVGMNEALTCRIAR